MARQRREYTPPAGADVTVTAAEVRQGMWVVDPETGEWAHVKEFTKRASVCSWGGDDVRMSLRRLGERQVSPGTPVIIRVPSAAGAGQ